MVFTVTLSAAVDQDATAPVVIPITVTDVTAVLTDDYTVPDPSSVTFDNDGGATEMFTIDTVGDSDASELAETFTVSLGTLPAGYDADGRLVSQSQLPTLSTTPLRPVT